MFSTKNLFSIFGLCSRTSSSRGGYYFRIYSVFSDSVLEPLVPEEDTISESILNCHTLFYNLWYQKRTQFHNLFCISILCSRSSGTRGGHYFIIYSVFSDSVLEPLVPKEDTISDYVDIKVRFSHVYLVQIPLTFS